MNTTELDNLKPKSSHGGHRPNAGRPKGAKNPETIEREAAAMIFKERVAKNADKLFNAQLSLATGTQMLFMIKTDSKGNRRKPELVTDVGTISRFLDENEGISGTLENDNTEYFFMTTSQPNNQALEGLLNRSFGKAEDKLDITTAGESLNDGAANPELAAEFTEFIKNNSKK